MKYDVNIYENFKLYYPDIVSHTVSCHPVGPFEVMATMDDGTQVIYNDFKKSIHYVSDREWERIEEDEWNDAFAANLRKLMKERNTNQTWLAKLTGLPQAYISNYVNGKTRPSPYNIYLITEALQCDVSELFNIDK